jgi:hypothetical protein
MQKLELDMPANCFGMLPAPDVYFEVWVTFSSE